MAGISVGCAGLPAGVNSSPQAPAPNAVQITLTPITASVLAGAQQQFSATLSSTSNTAVVWHATGGTISSNGLFTAPQASTATRITVTATSVANSSVSASANVSVSPAVKLSLQVAKLPIGTAGTPYSTTLAVTGGTTPYNFQITSGSLPEGFNLDRNSGLISGMTLESGSFPFSASVTDASSATVTGSMSLTVNLSTAGNFDGPAELPRVYVKSDLASTPAPGSVISLPKGGDFQQALNRVNCGDTISLEAGATYTGQFKLPARTCDGAHWIIIRTSAPDSALPPEGTRVSPCYAGVTSLPARPAFNCASSHNVMARIEFASSGSGPIIFTNGANHYRFIGLEITRAASTEAVFSLVSHDLNASADHLVFDRCWFHGTTQDETTRGFNMSATRYTAVVDSYFSDFHCVAMTGACTDAQAVSGGLGDVASGPFKIVNNFLEAAGENVLFGGGQATVTPADIEIRHNHMFKPTSWRKGQPGFVGGRDGNPFIVKNLFELKNAQRVLLEGNIMENSWGGFTQAGFGIVVGPKNQAVGDTNVCPMCQVTDVTIRYLKISHVGGGLQLGNGISDKGGVAFAGQRYSVHDITIDDIDPVKYIGHGDFAQVSMGPGAPLLQNVTINHVTAFQPGAMLNIGDNTTVNQQMRNFVYLNNLVNAGPFPTQTTGGGPANCAYGNEPNVVLAKCFQTFQFSHNAIVATPSNRPPSQYPAGNFFPASMSAVDFMNYANGSGGDYRLASSSRYKNAGTDGKDLGADIEAIAAAVAGAE